MVRGGVWTARLDRPSAVGPAWPDDAASDAAGSCRRLTLVNATLGYAGFDSGEREWGSGTLTWLPLAGRVIRQGRGAVQDRITATRWCCCTATVPVVADAG